MIYLIGGSGGPNFGDDLILSLWLDYYRKSGYDGPIIVDCLSQDRSTRLHGRFKNVFFITKIKALAKGREGDYSFYVDRGRKYISNEYSTPPELSELLDTDKSQRFPFHLFKHVHLYGGGYINGVWKNSASLLGAAAEIAERYQIPCYATGLGMAPLGRLNQDEIIALRQAISNFDVFELRDIESFNEINGALGFSKNVIMGLDDTYITPIQNLLKPIPGRSLHISGFSRSALSAGIGQLSKQILDNFDNVFFWVCNKSDVDLGFTLQNELPSLRKLTNNHLINYGIPVSRNDYALTARFHPHMISARAGAKGVYFAGSDFYRAKHASVVDLGSPYANCSTLDQAFELMLSPFQGNITVREEDYVKRKSLLVNYVVRQLVPSL